MNTTGTARLNPGQFQAVHILDGPALILAGPGTGKTKVLTERIRYLTEERRIMPESILVITFSKAAADEMKERYLGLVNRKETDVCFGTFHSVFLSLLKSEGKSAGIRVAERPDQIKALNQAMLSAYGKHVYTSDMLNLVLDEISKIKNGMGSDLAEAKNIRKEYDQALSERKMMDYDDMLSQTLEMLANRKDIAGRVQKRFAYILIDEFQDINTVQYEIVKIIAGDRKNVFCVGDDDQSIYGFRGSDPSYMKQFPKDFPGCRIIELKVNYRSTENIVTLSQNLIRKNRFRYSKNPVSQKGKGPDPVIARFPAPEEESAYITRKVRESIKVDPNLKISVLGRTNRVLSEVKEHIPDDVLCKISFYTFHSAKGLEFDMVFLAGCNEEITPGLRVSGEKEMEEERRVFYVAATRAKRYLYFLTTKKYRDKEARPSGFLKEML